MPQHIKAPFPYFGGKRRVAAEVWRRFGDVVNYVEPFAGSLAVLLGRPTPPRTETVNDADCYLSNFWRALRAEPEAVAEWADWPVIECDLEARHKWLVERTRKRELHDRMHNDPEFYDAKIAGWWVWGLCAWIGTGWCAGEFVGPGEAENRGRGVNTKDGKLPELYGSKGVHRVGIPAQIQRLTGSQGVNRQIPHLGHAGKGVNRQIPHLGHAGKGVNRQIPHLGGGGGGQGVHAFTRRPPTADWFNDLAARLRRVRVCCGDWKRIMGPIVTWKIGLTGVFLDPPYSDLANRSASIYRTDDLAAAHAVREWAIANGDNPLLRIAVCGYEGEHEFPEGWHVHAWKAQGGYAHIHPDQRGAGTANRDRERTSFSPHCLNGGGQSVIE
jgi:hypothetical protein